MTSTAPHDVAGHPHSGGRGIKRADAGTRTVAYKPEAIGSTPARGEDLLEEFLDIVAENDQVIGQEKRSVVHQSGLWHRGVHVFLFTPEHRLVIQQRSRRRKQSPGALDCSVSEHLKAGESYLDGATRGLEEELGIHPAPLRRLVHFKMNYGPGDNMVSTLFEGTVEKEALRPDEDEIERIIYLSIPEAEERLAHGEVLYSRWFEQLLLWYVGKSSDLQVIDPSQAG